MWQTWKCDETKKKQVWWQNLNAQNVTELNNPKFDKIQQLKLWQNSKTQNVTKPKKLKMSQLEMSLNEKTKKWQLKMWEKLKNSKSDKT